MIFSSLGVRTSFYFFAERIQIMLQRRFVFRESHLLPDAAFFVVVTARIGVVEKQLKRVGGEPEYEKAADKEFFVAEKRVFSPQVGDDSAVHKICNLRNFADDAFRTLFRVDEKVHPDFALQQVRIVAADGCRIHQVTHHIDDRFDSADTLL